MKISSNLQSSSVVSSVIRLLCAVVCAGFVSIALAATAADAPPAGGSPPGHMGSRMHHHMMHALKHLRAELKLTDAQSPLWDAALEKMKPSPDARQGMREHHHEMMDELKSADFDPHHWAADMDKMHAEREAHMKDVRDAWLAVWDSLDADQRTKVRHFLMHMHHMGGGHHHAAAATPAAAPAKSPATAAPAATPAPAAAPAAK